jgi:hypothetical protein
LVLSCPPLWRTLRQLLTRYYLNPWLYLCSTFLQVILLSCPNQHGTSPYHRCFSLATTDTFASPSYQLRPVSVLPLRHLSPHYPALFTRTNSATACYSPTNLSSISTHATLLLRPPYAPLYPFLVLRNSICLRLLGALRYLPVSSTCYTFSIHCTLLPAPSSLNSATAFTLTTLLFSSAILPILALFFSYPRQKRAGLFRKNYYYYPANFC